MTDLVITIVPDDSETIPGREKNWETISPQSEYDAIHAVAGAILAEADMVQVERQEDEER